ncbi:MAG: VOC family protein [Pseudomonadota bacterium]
MVLSLSTVTLVVPDYDADIAYFTGILGFHLIADEPVSDTKRWVVVAPSPDAPMRLLLARAANAVQARAIGNQTGGRVFLFLETDDFAADHARLSAAGVDFQEEPRHEVYGTVAVFADPFGNRWDLVEYT